MINLLGVNIKKETKKHILDKIEKYTSRPEGFFHIVSLNPEILTIAQKNKNFRKVVNTAQTHIVDGFGVVLGGWMLGHRVGDRLTGTDLMGELMDLAIRKRLTVMLIGGRPNLAKYLADCYNEKSSEKLFFGLEGIKNIKSPKKAEEEEIFSIIRDTRPSFLFVSFGSPSQELWLYRNRHKLRGIVSMGVGGAIDFLSGRVRRAPLVLRKLGLEWTWRLIRQPWRLKRQLSIPKFIWLVFKQKLNSH